MEQSLIRNCASEQRHTIHHGSHMYGLWMNVGRSGEGPDAAVKIQYGRKSKIILVFLDYLKKYNISMTQ